MSEENIEQKNVKIVLEGFARYNADEGGLERRLRTLPELMAAYWQPDAEYHTDSRDPDSEIHRGIDAVTRHLANWFEAYPDLKVEPVEAKASGDKVFGDSPPDPPGTCPPAADGSSRRSGAVAGARHHHAGPQVGANS